MMKLSNSQLIVLTAACQRDDGCAFPVTSKLKGNAAGNVLKSLLNKGLLEEVQAARDDTVWRHDEELGSVTLRATWAGYAALGLDGGPDETEREGAQVPTRRVKSKEAGSGVETTLKPTRTPKGGKQGATAAESHKSRAGTKQAELVAMLNAAKGATIQEIAKALGWQPHTVRGAIAGALKKRLGLNISSEKIEGRGRVYRIAD